MSGYRPEIPEIPEADVPKFETLPDDALALAGVDVCEFIPAEALPYIDFCDVCVSEARIAA